MAFAAHARVQGKPVGLGNALQPGIWPVQRADGADHEGLASLLRADCNPVRDGTTQDLRHGIGVFGRVEVQPGALSILLQQSLSYQAVSNALTDALNQVFQLAPGRRLDMLKPG
jgi:hypothetical protein